MLNILTETPNPVFKQQSGKSRQHPCRRCTAALMADDVIAFPALRPHQRHAWHAFLVQLGAMAIHRDGKDAPPEDADKWAKVIPRPHPQLPGR